MNQYITTWKTRKEKEQKAYMVRLCASIGLAILTVAYLYVALNITLGLN